MGESPRDGPFHDPIMTCDPPEVESGSGAKTSGDTPGAKSSDDTPDAEKTDDKQGQKQGEPSTFQEKVKDLFDSFLSCPGPVQPVRKKLIEGRDKLIEGRDKLIDKSEHAAEDWESWHGAKHEVFNAVTMIFPALFCFYLVYTMPSSVECPDCAWLIFFAVLIHLPFSVLYHSMCVAHSYGHDCNTENYRCLDQTFIHVSSSLGCWALSRSIVYTLCIALPFNVYCIFMLWYARDTEPRYKRFVRMGLCLVLYLAPLAFRGYWFYFWAACVCFVLLSALFFISDIFLSGWGHGIMHLMLVPFLCIIIVAAMGMPSETRILLSVGPALAPMFKWAAAKVFSSAM